MQETSATELLNNIISYYVCRCKRLRETNDTPFSGAASPLPHGTPSVFFIVFA